MLSIFAIFSDLPYYLAELFSKLTGADTSAITDGFSKIIAQLFEVIDKITA